MENLNHSKGLESQVLNYLAVDLAESLLDKPEQKDIDLAEKFLIRYQHVLQGDVHR